MLSHGLCTNFQEPSGFAVRLVKSFFPSFEASIAHKEYTTGKTSKPAWEKWKSPSPEDWDSDLWNSPSLTAVASDEEYIAVGDESGRVVVLRVNEPHGSNMEKSCADDEIQDTQGSAAASYAYCSVQQCYAPHIDPLDRRLFSPLVTSMAFLPSFGPRPLLLTTDERIPKLYRLVELEETPPSCSLDSFFHSGAYPTLSSLPIKRPFHSEEKCGGGMSFPAIEENSFVSLQVLSSYTGSHVSPIIAVAPLGVGGEQFVTADRYSMRLWCTEYSDVSQETCSKLFGDDYLSLHAMDGLETVRTFPQCPSLVFGVTTYGKVHLLDSRLSLQWDKSPVTLDFSSAHSCDASKSYPSRTGEEQLSRSFSDCALHYAGTQVISRNFSSVFAMDLRYAKAGVVSEWKLYASERGVRVPSLDAGMYLNYTESLSGAYPFQLQYLTENIIITGGVENHVITLNTSVEGEKNNRRVLNLTSDVLSQGKIVEETGLGAVNPEKGSSSKEDEGGDTLCEPNSCYTSLISSPQLTKQGIITLGVATGPRLSQLSFSLEGNS